MSEDPERTVLECTVPFDDLAGCGVNVERNLFGDLEMVGITFVTNRGPEEPHDLTMRQVSQLCAVLENAALIRPAPGNDRRLDEDFHTVVMHQPA